MDQVYETEKLLHEYLLFHYGTPEEVLPYPFGPHGALAFPLRSVNECLDQETLPPQARALDLGCAVGRSSFELARSCAEVIGIDYSTIFIEAAQILQAKGALDYKRKIVGQILEPAIARVPPEIDRGRVHFEVGDAHQLPETLGSFDLLHAANLLCRMRDPRRLLARLPTLVKPAGQLILTTPNTWLEEFAPSSHWLGGTPETGEPLEILKAELGQAFTLQAVKDLPFLIREHVRKFQWSVAQATLWRRLSMDLSA